MLYPILKRQNEILALGFVTARIMESVFIAIGLFALLTVVTLEQETPGADAGTLSYALAAMKDWTFILGPGFIVGLGNGLILGYLMYRSGLVPRRLAMLGLIGGPLICISGSPRHVRRRRPGRDGAGPRDHPGVLLGARPRPLSDVQGLQAVPILEEAGEEARLVPQTA